MRIGARGEWESLSTTEATIKLALVAAAAGIALFAWAPKLPAILALLR